ANRVALDYFRSMLFEPRYQVVLEKYLRGKREISDKAIEHFQLGLAGEQWDGLIKYARDKDLMPDQLVEAGLALKNEERGSYFDRFRQRLIIPIFNLSDNPIAFGGRTLRKGEPAKYVNSPETPLYNKSSVLYGLNQARGAIRDAGFAYVVEGYFDVISLWQADIANVVASSGTAFTAQQARLLARFADEVYLFFDADSAGRTAAIRSVDVLYDAGLEVRVIEAPEGEDPDSIARQQGSEGIEALRQNALGFVAYRVRNVQLENTGVVGREKLVKELRAVGNRIADITRRELFFDEAAHRLGVNQSLFRMDAQSTPEPTARPRSRTQAPDEFNFLSLLFVYDDDLEAVFETIAPDDLDSKKLSRLYSAMIAQYRDLGRLDAARLVQEQADTEFRALIAEVASVQWDDTDITEKLRTAIQVIMEMKRRRVRTKLMTDLKKAEAAGDTEEANRLLREIEGYFGDD
ncbi:toprim domain-containing protein, partial [candidate division GN15 bacterium]|nr:toprim domain-containing protein [candidate division GN15 bacterium]